jgi:membrane protease YdiL (CAAX protease family)
MGAMARRVALLAVWVAIVIAMVLIGTVTARIDDPMRRLLLGNGAIWGLTLLLLAGIVLWEERPLASIGLVKPTRTAVLVGVAAILVVGAFAVTAGAAMKLSGIPLDDQQQNRLLVDSPVWLQAFVVISAGFTEEILFRGYPIERVIELTHSRWLGGLAPVFLFGAVHVPTWGIPHAIVAAVAGIGFTLIYLWRRNLWTNITAHVVFDGLALAGLNLAAARGLTVG